MASANKNTLSGKGTRLPKRATMPMAKAISVAMGIAQPE